MSLFDRLLGRTLATAEEEHHKVGVLEGIPMLGLDALASAAYGPEAALAILLPLGAAGVGYIGPLTAIILVLLGILYLSYRQTIAAYPSGGGSYTVAKENLGQRAGLIAAAALILDFILAVCVGISAGIGALVSAFTSLHGHELGLCLLVLALLALVNLRGLKESGVALAVPTYLFVLTLGGAVIYGVFQTIAAHGHPVAIVRPEPLGTAIAPISLWLLAHAFASGCTAMTGVEAVSNGVKIFRNPSVGNAQGTLTAIVVILGVLLAGIAYLCRAYGISATDPNSPGYQSVLSQILAAVAGRGVFYYVSIGAILTVLALSANTGFAGFPQLCRLLANDDFLPHAFSNRGRRLVYSYGIAILTAASALILIAFGGITERLIPLFAVGAFLAFTMSQAGMVVHWRRNPGAGSGISLAINALGCAATGAALAVIIVAKFAEGAWVTLLLIPGMVVLFQRVKRHYEHVHEETRLTGPISCFNLQPPIVLIPIKDLTLITRKAIRFALKLSSNIIAVHIGTDEDEQSALQAKWMEWVEKPAEQAGLTPPHLVLITSPYRRLFGPLLEYLDELKEQSSDRQIAVIIPELVESRWYQYLLHNQRAAALKAALLLRGGQQVVVINVPWYLTAEEEQGSEVSAGWTQDEVCAPDVVGA